MMLLVVTTVFPISYCFFISYLLTTTNTIVLSVCACFLFCFVFQASLDNPAEPGSRVLRQSFRQSLVPEMQEVRLRYASIGPHSFFSLFSLFSVSHITGTLVLYLAVCFSMC